MGFDIRQLLAGIGILLYGIHNFEQALNYLGGKKLKYFLQKYTKNSWMAIWTGTWTTTLLQSSTLVSLLTLAFVGAGVMALPNAVGVIIGANIGSPMLPLLAALIGFGEFDIGSIALPLIGVGALILMFIKNEKRQRYAKLIIGFGLFFVGIGRMKESVEALRDSFDISVYKSLPLIGFGVLGMIFSAMMSSSGALGIITLAAVDGGIISFPASVAIMMGANIGTTRTAFLASLGGNKVKRQVAMSHVLFNVLSTVIGVALFWQYIRISNELLGLKDNPALSNAVLAVVYNVSTAVLFGFIIKPFTRLVVRLVPDKQNDKELMHIERILKQVGNDARLTGPQVLALMEDSKELIHKTIEYTTYIYGLLPQKMKDESITSELIKENLVERNKQHHIILYEHIKSMTDTMIQVVLRLKPMTTGKDNTSQLHHIETIIYSCLKAIKATKNIRHELVDLRESIDPVLEKLYPNLLEMLIIYYRQIYSVMEHPVNENGHHDQSEKNTYNSEQLVLAFGTIKHIHQEFTHLFYEANQSQGIEEIHVTSLINIDHYIYETLEMLFIATAHLYLPEDQIDLLEQVVDVDEEIYESFSTNQND